MRLTCTTAALWSLALDAESDSLWFYDLFGVSDNPIYNQEQSIYSVCVVYSLPYCGNRDRLWVITRKTQ